MLGYKDYSENFVLKQTLNGIESTYDAQEKIDRYPLTACDMLKMFELLDMDDNDNVLFWVSALLCFRGLLRVGQTTQSLHNLRVSNVSLGPNFTSIRIVSSKTDQFGKSPFTIYLQHMPGSPFCVSPFLQKIMKGSSKKEFLLTHKVQGMSFPVGYRFINSKLKELAFTLGLPVDRVSTHSFRHGGTNLLKELGMPVSSIMLKGNWKSSTVYKYLHQSARDLSVLEKAPCSYFSSLM